MYYKIRLLVLLMAVSVLSGLVQPVFNAQIGLLNAEDAAPVKVNETTKPAVESKAVKKQEVPPTMTKDWSKGHPLTEVLQAIAQHAGVNIIPDLDIKETDIVKMQVNDMEWQQVLDEVINQTNCVLTQVKEGVYRVTKPIKIEANFDGVPLETVVQYIAAQAKLNLIIVPADLAGKIVTVHAKGVPWPDLMDTVVKNTGLVMVREKHNVVRIVREEALKKQLETKVFRFKYLQPPSPYTPQITTSYAKGAPKDVADPVAEFTVLNTLKSMLTPGAGRMDYDKTTNSILVTDIKPVLDAMEKIINEMDVEPAQILIDVKFVNTANTDLLQFGLRYAKGSDKGWTVTSIPHSWARGTTAMGATVADTTPPTLALSDTTGATEIVRSKKITTLPFGRGQQMPEIDQLFLSEYDVKATLRLFKGDDTSKLIQSPSVLALDGRPTTIFVGETIRYAQTTAAASQSGGVTYSISEASASPAKVGFQLLVVPYIVKGVNKVMLTIIPQYELLSGTSSPAVAGFERFTITGATSQSIDLPRKRESTVLTQMVVESGKTAVIGGLATDRIQRSKEKIPFLGDIPVLGWAFKYRSDNRTKDHLLVYVTPTILKSAESSMEILKEKIQETDTIKIKPMTE